MKKILTSSSTIRMLLERRFKSVVFMSGAFDLFHFGHYKALTKASGLGEILIVQIDGDQLVKKRKGDGRPYLKQVIRASMIASLDFVDFVFISNIPSEDSRLLSRLKPDILVRAILPNESDIDRSKREKILLEKAPATKIVWLKQTPEISTTKINSALIDANSSLLDQQKNLTMKSTTLANK